MQIVLKKCSLQESLTAQREMLCDQAKILTTWKSWKVILKNILWGWRRWGSPNWFIVFSLFVDNAAVIWWKSWDSFSSVQFSSVQSLSCVWLFATPWIAARQASLSITISRSSLRLTSIESVMPSSRLILGRPLSSCPQSLPASESFPMSQLLTWGGQSTGASALASFLPKKPQGWCPSEWTGWISLQSKGLSRVFSNTAVQKHQFFGSQPSSQSNSHIHT